MSSISRSSKPLVWGWLMSGCARGWKGYQESAHRAGFQNPLLLLGCGIFNKYLDFSDSSPICYKKAQSSRHCWKLQPFEFGNHLWESLIGLKRRLITAKVIINHSRPQGIGSSFPENRCCQHVVKEGMGAGKHEDFKEIGLLYWPARSVRFRWGLRDRGFHGQRYNRGHPQCLSRES